MVTDMANQINCLRCELLFEPEALTVDEEEGLAVCHDCSAQLRPAGERPRCCPLDGREMRKLVIYDLVLIDKCESCGGVWLDQSELKIIEKASRRSATVAGSILGSFSDAENRRDKN